jgi:hypothetical protein
MMLRRERQPKMNKDKITQCSRLAGAALVVSMLFCLASAAPALADGAWWSLSSSSWPATLPSSGEGRVVALAQNLGDAPVDSGTLTVTDKLPASVVPQSVAFFIFPFNKGQANISGSFCQIAGQEVTCQLPEHVVHEFPLVPYDDLELRIAVKVEGAASGVENEVSLSSAGAPPASLARSLAIGSGPPPFGLSDYEMTPENADGSVDTQAGSHPFQLTTKLLLNQTADPAHPPAIVKDLHFNLPPGLIGNPTPIPQCSSVQFGALTGTFLEWVNACPQNTVVGVAAVTLDEPLNPGIFTLPAPLFNLKPQPGEPARFGFLVAGVPVILDTSVRTGGDYGVTVTVKNISELASLIGSQVTFWGVPGDPRHDHARGWSCVAGGILAIQANLPPCSPLGLVKPPPFLILPTSCTGPLRSTVEGDSWSQPGALTEPLDALGLPALDGCNALSFSPSIRVTPDGTAASTPTGLNVDVHVPQDSVLVANGLAESNVRDITVALPEGVAVNPAGGDGLQACSEGLVGFEAPPASEPPEHLHFTATLPDPLQQGMNFCPDASKIGTVTIHSPLLPNPIVGAVYLATQNQNPFGSLIGLYLVAKDPISGFVFKSAGETRLTPSGQLIGTFKNNPQLPFEDAELHFFGGERAPLSTPAHCGPYTTDATFAPWSGNEAVESSSTFNITAGPNGSPCPGTSLPFSPSLTAGMTNINAGAFSPLTTTIGRADGQQDMQSVQLHMPAGLEGLLSGVKLCPEQQANEGTCGPESLIGETTVSAGVGNDPVSVTGGKVYITEKYAGAPFGLSIVNPVKAGPFDLERDTSNPAQNPPCDCVVVRAKVEVDPTTAALTITTDPSGPYAIPHLIDGIPVQIQKVNVLVNRPGFTFNPTNCSPQPLTGAIASDEGAAQPVSVPFQVTNCATLKFTPKFSVSTSGKTSKANGASLVTKLAEPPGSLGTQANITKVKVELPKQLPSRLTTLQKACTNAQFNSNPAGCPAASLIGHATVHTPLLPVPLTGPAIFVSHGGEAFPSLVIVLQGYGVTVDLVGTTFISKAGITSTTFKTVPDTPFNDFELTLPQGKFSALASNLPAKANGSFCGQKLVMPSEFIAQNGAALHQSTPVSVSGCAKKKALTRKQKLARALKACKKTAKGKRAACVSEARRRFGAVKQKAKKSKKK